MKKTTKKLFTVLTLVIVLLACALPAFAAEAENAAAEAVTTAAASGDSLKTVKAVVAGAVICIVAGVGAVGMTVAICKSNEGIARQPEAAGNIRSGMMLGLVFIETAIIYALIVAILVIFVL